MIMMESTAWFRLVAVRCLAFVCIICSGVARLCASEGPDVASLYWYQRIAAIQTLPQDADPVILGHMQRLARSDADPRVRDMATARLLRWQGDLELIDVALDSSVNSVRWAALQAVVRLPTSERDRLLVQILRDERVELRRAAMRALEMWAWRSDGTGPKPVDDSLLDILLHSALNDPSPSVRWQATIAMPVHQSWDMSTTLRFLLPDPEHPGPVAQADPHFLVTIAYSMLNAAARRDFIVLAAGGDTDTIRVESLSAQDRQRWAVLSQLQGRHVRVTWQTSVIKKMIGYATERPRPEWEEVFTVLVAQTPDLLAEVIGHRPLCAAAVRHAVERHPGGKDHPSLHRLRHRLDQILPPPHISTTVAIEAPTVPESPPITVEVLRATVESALAANDGNALDHVLGIAFAQDAQMATQLSVAMLSAQPALAEALAVTISSHLFVGDRIASLESALLQAALKRGLIRQPANLQQALENLPHDMPVALELSFIPQANRWQYRLEPWVMLLLDSSHPAGMQALSDIVVGEPEKATIPALTALGFVWRRYRYSARADWPAALSDLARASLRNRDPAVVRLGALMLRLGDAPAAEAWAREHFMREEAWRRRLALELLAGIDPEMALQSLDDPDAEVRMEALWLAADIQRPAIIPRMAAALGDPAPMVRLAAMYALHRHGHAEATTALQSAAKQADDDLANLATQLLRHPERNNLPITKAGMHWWLASGRVESTEAAHSGYFGAYAADRSFHLHDKLDAWNEQIEKMQVRGFFIQMSTE